MFSLTVLLITLGSVSAIELDDKNSTSVLIDENSQFNEINEINVDDSKDTLSVSDENEKQIISEDSEDVLSSDVSLEVVDYKTSYSTSDSITVKMGTYSLAGESNEVDVYLNGKTIGKTTYGVISGSGYAVPLTTAQNGTNSIYCTLTTLFSTGLTSDTVTFTVSGSGSVTPSQNASASISIYDRGYPSQSVIVSNGAYVADIAYSIVKSGDGFNDESLEVFVNGLSVGVTTPNVSNRLGNLTLEANRTYVVNVVYSATVDGKVINVSSNQLTFNTTVASGDSPSQNASVSISIYDRSFPSQSVIVSNGAYVADIAYSIVKSGDGFNDESLEVFVNGLSVGVTTPNVSNRLGNLTLEANRTYVVNVVYSATVDGKVINVSSNELDFNTTVTSGDNPEPASDNQLIIRDLNYPNNATVSLTSNYNAVLQYYAVVPSSSLIINQIVIICNDEGIITIENPNNKTFTSIGKTIFLNESGNYTFKAQYKYWDMFSGLTGEIYSNSIVYHVAISNESETNKTLSVSVADVDYPNNITAVVKSNVDGMYIVKIDNYTKEVYVSEGIGSINFSLSAGSYTAVVSSKTDSKLTNKTLFNVKQKNKEDPTISVSSSVDGNKATIEINLPDDVNENIIVSIDETNYNVIVTNGIGSFIKTALSNGNHSYNVSFAGNDKYNCISHEGFFVIGESSQNTTDKENITICVNEKINKDRVTLQVILPSDVDGNVLISFGGDNISVVISNGTGSLFIPDLTNGSYTYDIVFYGNKRYNRADYQGSFIVNESSISSKINPTMSSYATVTESNAVIKVNLPDDVNCNVVLKVGSDYYNVSIANGAGRYELSNLVSGSYNYTITFGGNDKYNSKVISGSFVIDSQNQNTTRFSIEANALTRAQNSPYDFKATFYDAKGNLLINTEVNFIINGNDHISVTDEYGVAKLVNCLSVGTYSIEIKNFVTEESLIRNVTILNRITGNSDVNVDYSYSNNYKIRILADNGNPAGAGEKVVITLNNIKYTVFSDKNGYVTFQINGLLPKTYTITSEYRGVKVFNTVVVKQILKAKNAKFKKSKKVKKYKVTLKTSSGKAIKGKKITLKVKGKTLKAKTNKKGVATFKIKHLKKVGKFKAKIKYLKTSIKKTIKIKR